jgi:TolB-like protein
MPLLDQTFRFGEFECDLAAYQLRHQGCAVSVERLPMALLVLLLENRGRLVRREEIAARLWGGSAFIDVDTGINIAIRKVRQALGDSSQSPAFVETVVGMGYRFIGPVTTVEPPSALAATRWVTLAVLPVDNLTGDPEQEYLADGLTEEAIMVLGRLDPQRLRLIGRQSMAAYKRTAKSIAEIGRELNSDYLIESSVRADEGMVRLTSRLIRVHDQLQLWCESYDREHRDILGLQRELSIAIAAQVHAQLSPERLAGVARRHTSAPDARDLYLRGRYYAGQRTPVTVTRALEYYRRATALDPAYALAWAGIADAYTSRPLNSDAAAREVHEHARAAAERAAAANPDLAETQTALGRVRFWLDWDWPAAQAAFLHAIELDGSCAEAHRMLGHLHSQRAQHIQAGAALNRAQTLDPLNAMVASTLSQIAYQAGDFVAAREHAEHALLLDCELWIAHLQAAQAHERMGSDRLALEQLARAAALSGNNSKVLSLKGYLFARSGRADDARVVLKLLESVSQNRYVPPVAIALVHAGLENEDRVFEWLDRATRMRDVHLAFLAVDPKWQRYHNDPRFRQLLERFVVPAPNVPLTS